MAELFLDEPFTRVLPRLTDVNRSFWQGGADGQLLIARCGACGLWMHPPSPVCPSCWSDEVAPQPVSGRGHVHTFTINRYQWVPGMEPPYVVASVELVEQAGLRFLTNIVGCEPEDVSCDMPVDVVFAPHGEVHVPLFRPAS
ncbi:MAG: OB-fold domain-containing protein [Acidimicrobiales bacterium]|nr:OB-fold domain-containing protein [Acidimicrobiales bacterium]